MKVAIIGAGPRGLSTALALLNKGIKPMLFDPKPLHTWDFPYIIPDIQMRSPITFDLVTKVESLQAFSLSSFLNKPFTFTTSQKALEECPIEVSREEFKAYINFIYEFISSCCLVEKEKVESIGINSIKTANQSYSTDAIIIATGSAPSKYPDWVKRTEAIDKIQIPKNLIANPPSEEEITVVGDGQGAAEMVYFLASNKNKVNWCIKKIPKVSQYPAPSYRDWYSKSALGNRYRDLISWETKLRYLGEIKSWQPSITPYIKEKLEQVKPFYTQTIPTSSDQLEFIFKSSSRIVLLTGSTPSVDNIPFEFEIEKNSYLPNFPNLQKGFRLRNFPIYFTGPLAISFDGPRQNSIISAGPTAQEISQDLLDALNS